MAAITVATSMLGVGAPVMAQAGPDELRHCAVSSGRVPETATPEEVGLDSAALRQAVALAADSTRTTLQIFRNNCLIAKGPNNARAAGVPWNLWSSTKSVVSMVAGIAVDEQRLRLDDPIGAYLPASSSAASARTRRPLEFDSGSAVAEHLVDQTLRRLLERHRQ
ncbi:serine hydrolase [Nocardia abscessus]|uniref:serine hydrolase n=1 Tax=Nocardia abscessus TaxID=120957 RepID=UPI00245730B9|nr:serine hydrolase [Nocardia abscessus]